MTSLFGWHDADNGIKTAREGRRKDFRQIQKLDPLPLLMRLKMRKVLALILKRMPGSNLKRQLEPQQHAIWYAA